MPRPVKKTVDYFPHDCDHKQTMFIVEQKYGNDGYATWFKLLEVLGRAENQYLDCNKPETWEYLQARMRLSSDRLLEILNTFALLDAIDRKLWTQKIIWSQNFINRLLPVYANRRQEIPSRPNGNKPVSTGKNSLKADNYSPKPTNNDVSTDNNPQTKVKESKRKEGGVGETAQEPSESQQQLLNELHKLPQWGDSQPRDDLQWLIEFKEEFPTFWIPHIRGCRDYHSRKSKHTKALWKSRLRNWMKHEQDKQEVDVPDKVAYRRL
jgi:hypothetical protein